MVAVRESIATLEDTERKTRRVLGSSHPEYKFTERTLQEARELLAAGPPTRIVLEGLPADIKPPEVRDFMMRWGGAPLHLAEAVTCLAQPRRWRLPRGGDRWL